MTYQVNPIGTVHSTMMDFSIEIQEPYRPGLKQLAQFSHVNVFWWAHENDNAEARQNLQNRPGYAQGATVGVFASRAELRPNPIAVTTCPIIAVDEANGIVRLAWIDAHDGTPVLDLKPYIPLSDRVRDVRVADWFANWPAYQEDAATFEFDPAMFEPYED